MRKTSTSSDSRELSFEATQENVEIDIGDNESLVIQQMTIEAEMLEERCDSDPVGALKQYYEDEQEFRARLAANQ